MRIKFALAIILLLQALPAAAYIGPGSGISLLGGLWGVIVAIFLALGAVLIWPVRYMFRRLRRKRREASGAVPDDDAAETSEAVDAEHTSPRSE